MTKKKKNKNEKYVLNFLAILIIVFLGMHHWQDTNLPAIFEDEFGYWGNAATLAGLNWKPLMSQTAYYSIGYSILLVPLFLLKDYTLRYHMAIAINIFLVIGSYFCAKYIINHLFRSNNKEELKIAGKALISVLTVSTIVQIKVAWPETLITFLMWLSVVLLISILEQYKVYKIVLCIFLLIYMVMVHQRTIPVVFVYILMLVLNIRSKKNRKKQIFLLVIGFAVLYFIYAYIKDVQVKTIYLDSISADANNYSLSLEFIQDYIRRFIDNIKIILPSFWAKLVIFNISSLFTFPLVAFIFLKALFKRDIMNTECLHVTGYVFLSALVMLGLTSVQMFGTDRADLTVYTRYFDYTIGPVLLFGLNFLEEEGKGKIELIFSSLVISVFSMVYIYRLIYVSSDGFNYSCSPFVGSIISWQDQYMQDIESIIFITWAVILLFYMGIFLFLITKTNRALAIFCTGVLIVNLQLSNQASVRIEEWRNYFGNEAVFLKDKISGEGQIYIVLNEESANYVNELRELQFVMYEKPLKIISNDLLFTISDSEYYLLSQEKYQQLLGNLITSTDIHKVNLYYVKK